MTGTTFRLITAAALSFAAVMPLAAQRPPADRAANPLEAFGALIVGEWLAEDTRHVHEWGVARKVIRSRTYFLSDGEWKLVSEGMWFWDAGQASIRGTTVAIGMPVELFEYRSEVVGRRVVHRLKATGEGGGSYVETWRFGDDEYSWDLEREVGGALERVMGGTFRRAAR